MSMTIASAPAATAVSINVTLPRASQKTPRPLPFFDAAFQARLARIKHAVGSFKPASVRSGNTRSMKNGSSSV